MKIVDVAEFYAEQGGGVRTYIDQKLQAGAARGHEVVVVAPGPRAGEERRLGGRIVWVQGPPLPPDPRYYVLYREREVHRILDRERPDLLEGSSPWTGGWFAARWRGDAARAFIFHADPVAVFPHTFLDRRLDRSTIDRVFGWYWAYLRRLSGRFDATVVAGAWLADRLRGFGLKRPESVPFGIDKGFFSPSRRDESVRRALLARCGVDHPGARLLLTVSRHHPEKRLPTLIRAFAEASRRRPMGLVVFGDGPLRRRIARLAEGVPGVCLAGYTRDRGELAAAYASADAMLHGSAAETYGLVVAEALCSGLPLVVPRRGGAADLAGPSYAETYAPGDVGACATAIKLILARDPAALRVGCAGAAQTRVASTEEHFDRLFELYERLAGGR